MVNDEHDSQGVKHLGSDGPSGWQKPLWIASAIFILALVGIVIWLVASKPAKVTPRPSQAQQPPAATSSTPAQTQASATACTLPAGDQTVPYATPPSGTTWGQVGSMSVPQAPSTLGPERTNGVWNTCFAHSPSGALLAAFNLWAEGTAAPSGQVYRHLAVNVPAAAYRTATRLDAEGPVQFAGYKYESYTPTAAQVFVVIKGAHGALEAAGTTMRWTGTDWRYDFPPNGTPALEQIPDLTGYVPWSAF